jgi:hypothetical protein
MIDGTRCYQAMSDLEQRRWQKAVITEQSTTIDFLLNRKYWTFGEFIVQSFIWSQTKEGHEYWSEISKKYVLHDILSPHKNFSLTRPLKPFN